MPAKIRWNRAGSLLRVLRVDDYEAAYISKMDGYWEVWVLGKCAPWSPVREKDARRLAEKHSCRITREISAILEAGVK